ncbi:MAG: hypothetical protein GXP30_03420 [Verrucomicrobia bacterium]|nr:hypothetical protein [Verrucomicrobiota bacterium]
MKSGPLLLLGAVLLVAVLNLLVSLGVMGPGASTSVEDEAQVSSPNSANWEYKVMNTKEMDEIGFRAVGKDEGIEPDEEGKMKLPQKKLLIQSLMPRTLEEIQKDGWELLTTELTQGGNFFIFRRAKQ